jgi:hypothetical protein
MSYSVQILPMAQRGDGARFTFEALPQAPFPRQVKGKDSNCNGSVQSLVIRAIDVAYSPAAQLLDDFEMTQFRAGSECG